MPSNQMRRGCAEYFICRVASAVTLMTVRAKIVSWKTISRPDDAAPARFQMQHMP
jgi:hypothetical protein